MLLFFNIKLLALENSRGLSCQFVIFSSVRSLIRFFLNSRNREYPVSVFLGFNYLFCISVFFQNFGEKRIQNIEILSTT